MLLSFVVLLDTPTFEARFDSVELSVMSVFERVATTAVPAARKITTRMEFKALLTEYIQRMSQFSKSGNLTLHVFETEHIFQVLKASLTVHT